MHGRSVNRVGSDGTMRRRQGSGTEGPGRGGLLRLAMVVQDEHPSWDAQNSEDGIRHFKAQCKDTRGGTEQRHSACQLLSGYHSNGVVRRSSLENWTKGAARRILLVVYLFSALARFPSLSTVDSRLSTHCDLCVESERSL